MNSRWFSGSAKIRTFELEEMLGTKLRALYQRKKGRDLLGFDYVFKEFPNLNAEQIVDSFVHYLEREDQKVSRAEFESNLFHKMQDKKFLVDIAAVMLNASDFDPQAAYSLVLKKFVPHLAGDPWKGHPDLKKKKKNS